MHLHSHLFVKLHGYCLRVSCNADNTETQHTCLQSRCSLHCESLTPDLVQCQQQCPIHLPHAQEHKTLQQLYIGYQIIFTVSIKNNAKQTIHQTMSTLPIQSQICLYKVKLCLYKVKLCLYKVKTLSHLVTVWWCYLLCYKKTHNSAIAATATSQAVKSDNKRTTIKPNTLVVIS